jgi:hypothetical protein
MRLAGFQSKLPSPSDWMISFIFSTDVPSTVSGVIPGVMAPALL